MTTALRGLIVAILLLLTSAVHAGDIRRETLPSPSLGRELPYQIYIPDGYQASERHYPVLYLLHGAGGDETTWTKSCALREKLDKLIASGAIPPTLVVMPGCPECWWIDGAREKSETAFWKELVPAIEARYSTIESRGGRLVAGLSAGGYGAVRYAMRYPDRIAAIAALSPAVYADTPPDHSSARSMPAFLGTDGKFDQRAWETKNYPRLIDSYFARRQTVPAYLVSGDRDNYGIAFETALLFKRMFARQPGEVALRVVEGDHSWDVWSAAIDDALKYIYRFAERPQLIAGPSAGSAPLVATRK